MKGRIIQKITYDPKTRELTREYPIVEASAASAGYAPIVLRDAWCDPSCPYLSAPKQCGITKGARCNHLDVDLDYYDGWLAACEYETHNSVFADPPDA